MSDMFNEQNIQVAQKSLENHINRSIHRAAILSAPQSSPNFNGCDCVRCGDPIPEKRLALGRIRCIECQTALES